MTFSLAREEYENKYRSERKSEISVLRGPFVASSIVQQSMRIEHCSMQLRPDEKTVSCDCMTLLLKLTHLFTYRRQTLVSNDKADGGKEEWKLAFPHIRESLKTNRCDIRRNNVVQGAKKKKKKKEQIWCSISVRPLSLVGTMLPGAPSRDRCFVIFAVARTTGTKTRIKLAFQETHS